MSQEGADRVGCLLALAALVFASGVAVAIVLLAIAKI